MPLWHDYEETIMGVFGDWIEDDYTEHEDNPFYVRDLVEYFLQFEADKLTDYIDETELLSDKVKKIIYDPNDDKLGRIRDIYDAEINRFARFVEDNYKSNKHANWVFHEALGDN
jgi:hypothetical protein